MSQKGKKLLIILSVILGLTLISLGIYYFFFKKTVEAPATVTDEELLGGEVTPSAKERLIPITEEAVLGAGLNIIDQEAGVSKIVYAAWDGSINQIDLNGAGKNKIGLVAVDRIGEVNVSESGELLSFKYSLASGANRFIIYNVTDKTLKTLSQETEDVSLSNSNKEAVIVYSDRNGKKIAISYDDFSKNRDIIPTKIPDIKIDWFNSDNIALTTRPSGVAQGIFYVLNIKTKKNTRVLGGEYGLTTNFSPSGKKVLVSRTNSDGRNLKLSSINLDKKTERNISLFTLPEKCSWGQDERILFCSVFKVNDPDIFVMPDDYYKRRVRSNGEEIVRINTETGQIQKVIDGSFDASNLFLVPDESYLFFINKIDGRLYRLTL
ncbi:MAG: hypothetical protein Q8Q95_03845 [bacterium]|nr:hypothetical protein [bacterium]